MKFREHKYLFAITVFVFIAIFVCILCNIAIDHHMTWLVYPVCSLVFGWGVFIPLIYGGRHGLVLSLGLLSALSLPYLLLLEQWTGIVGWFVPVAFPITLAAIIYAWLLYVVLPRKVGVWMKTALLCVSGGILSLLVYFYLVFVSRFEMFAWGWVTFGSAVAVAALLFLAGHIHDRQTQ
ncbi:MAG TPA: DUF6320 domain-containing protein [Methanocorpusculum sp.]|nr:DUF6320 domain-containing protein [Methanocorpusculum sp.]